jgi:hypothetical protein
MWLYRDPESPMQTASYPDTFRGFPPERPATSTELADEACREALAEAETLAGLLDRHAGDSGEHADALRSITDRLESLTAEVRALLGEPRVLRGGRLVVVGSAA